MPGPRAPDDLADLLVSTLRQLQGQAIGLWRVETNRLVQVDFRAPSIDAEVANAFATATLSLSLDRRNLGIVQAATQGRIAVSIARQLPADTGSGFWLRAFGSERSVAVPLVGRNGQTGWVFSIALGLVPEDDEVARQLRQAASPYLTALE